MPAGGSLKKKAQLADRSLRRSVYNLLVNSLTALEAADRAVQGEAR
jgi:hypothetical protein